MYLSVPVSVNDYINTYDSMLRITKIMQQCQAERSSVAAKRIEFAYNAIGRISSVTRYADLANNTKLVATSTYGYDAVGRNDNLSHAKSTTTLNAYTWFYEALGRPTQQTSTDGTDTITNDASSQVTAATHTSQANESNSYNATGNRTFAGYCTGMNNQLLSF